MKHDWPRVWSEMFDSFLKIEMDEHPLASHQQWSTAARRRANRCLEHAQNSMRQIEAEAAKYAPEDHGERSKIAAKLAEYKALWQSELPKGQTIQSLKVRYEGHEPITSED